MKVDVLLGLQWGDEGKGKVVDVLLPDEFPFELFPLFPESAAPLHSNDT